MTHEPRIALLIDADNSQPVKQWFIDANLFFG
jgi:hypothetical protein